MSDPGRIEAAAGHLADELDEDVYVLVGDGQRYLLGELALLGVAKVLLDAFLDGVLEGATGQVRDWGRHVGERLAQRVQDVVRRDAEPTSEDPELAGKLEHVLRATGDLAPEERRRLIDDAERELADALVGRGLTPTGSQRLAGQVAGAARGAL